MKDITQFTPSQILREIANEMERRPWNQGNYSLRYSVGEYTDVEKMRDDPDEPCCALGCSFVVFDTENIPFACSEAFLAVADGHDILEYNDQIATSKWDVISKLREAAAWLDAKSRTVVN